MPTDAALNWANEVLNRFERLAYGETHLSPTQKAELDRDYAKAIKVLHG